MMGGNQKQSTCHTLIHAHLWQLWHTYSIDKLCVRWLFLHFVKFGLTKKLLRYETFKQSWCWRVLMQNGSRRASPAASFSFAFRGCHSRTEAIRYHDTAVLENFHLATAFELMRSRKPKLPQINPNAKVWPNSGLLVSSLAISSA